jgi:predicted methyltransferase
VQPLYRVIYPNGQVLHVTGDSAEDVRAQTQEALDACGSRTTFVVVPPRVPEQVLATI